MTAPPEALLKAMAPSREQIVVAAEGMFPWYWLADLCAEHGYHLKNLGLKVHPLAGCHERGKLT